MLVAIGSDHAGFELKEDLKAFLGGGGHDVLDVGTDSQEPVDYPVYCAKVAHAVAGGRAERSLAWDLGGEAETVGLRRPRHLLALAVLERTGPLAVTSANLSGRPTASTCEDLVATFGDDVAVYLCQEESLEGVASTVVGLAHGEPAILREGGIRAADVLHVLRAADVAPGS